MSIGFTGCTQQENPIEAIDFNVTFNELNLEKNYADFIVYGYPNEREFEQIPVIIKSSLDKQNVKDGIKVNVYSSLEEEENNPFFGTATYTNNELKTNKLKQRTEDEYLKLAQ